MTSTTATASTRRLLLSSALGTVVEWYDFFAFVTASALVFDRVFFPTAAPLRAVLLALMTYAVGFVTRPLGGLVFGVLGDRHGRKRVLVWSLVLMGAATVGVGLVPGYATIGVAAPVLLLALRLTQGFAVGGEVGGALLLVSESLDARRRGFWAAWPQVGGPAGNLLVAGVFGALTATLSRESLLAWGWRVPFLLSGLLIGVGVWMRTRVEESPIYLRYAARRGVGARAPLAAVLASRWREMLTVFLVKAGENALFYVFTTFFVVYVTKVLHRPAALALSATMIASAVEVATVFAAGALSDRVGRRPVTAAGLLAASLWAFALFPLTRTGGATTVVLAAAAGGLCHGVIVGGMSAFFVELFPTASRYTGFSAGYQLASVASGAVAPIIGVTLLARYGSSVPVSVYAAGMVVPALVALWMSRETRGVDLAE